MAKAGRPIEYKPKILKSAKAYLDSCKDEETVKQIGEKEVVRLKVRLPSIEGLAVYLGVHRSTIYDWKDKYSPFSDILEQILSEQAQRLVNNGLSGDYNSTISKLILTKHGYSDKQEITGADGKDLIPTPILGNLNVLPTDDRNESNSEAVETDTRGAGRNISEQDDLDTSAADSSRSVRQEPDADERSI